MEYEAVIGLEVHAELETESKMFCTCPVVDSTIAEPNIAVCPVCAGMPGVLPVINARAVEYALKVALALNCQINQASIFARKNYFYPDLPKGYQISQYEQPLGVNGKIMIVTSSGQELIRVRRVHLEEDTGKLTHVTREGTSGEKYSLVDLNRAGVPLLEIVSEPDLRTPEQVRAYSMGLRSIMRYLGVNSGDMQKGVLRIEPNVSVRRHGSHEFGIRTEIKNLNSFRALERAVAYEIERQSELLRKGMQVVQETLGWDDVRGITVTQRSKEEAHDYRYFPEPDLPPLVVSQGWIEEIRSTIPELPVDRLDRFVSQYGLSVYDAGVLTMEQSVANYFEGAATFAPAKTVANWITSDLFGLMNKADLEIDEIRVTPQALAGLIQMVMDGVINQNTAKSILAEMFEKGRSADDIIDERGLRQISDVETISGLIENILRENPGQVEAYLGGKETLLRWFFGQVMRAAEGKANPQVVQQQLEQHLAVLKGDIPG